MMAEPRDGLLLTVVILVSKKESQRDFISGSLTTADIL